MPEITLEQDPARRIAVLRVTAPPMNALAVTTWPRWSQLATEIASSPDIRAVVIWGGPDVFGVGADVRTMAELNEPEFRQMNRVLQQGFEALANVPAITIAAVNGYALGGGCELALAADFRFMAEDARMGLPEVKLGIMPGSGGTQRLPRLVGLSRAKELVLSGRLVGAEEALRIGLANRVLPAAEVFDAACEQAESYASGPSSITAIKRAMDRGTELPIEAGLDLEAELIGQSFSSHDGRVGLRSFLENGVGHAEFRGQ